MDVWLNINGIFLRKKMKMGAPDTQMLVGYTIAVYFSISSSVFPGITPKFVYIYHELIGTNELYNLISGVRFLAISYSPVSTLSYLSRNLSGEVSQT
jgi:hypothetical protein